MLPVHCVLCRPILDPIPLHTPVSHANTWMRWGGGWADVSRYQLKVDTPLCPKNADRGCLIACNPGVGCGRERNGNTRPWQRPSTGVLFG